MPTLPPDPAPPPPLPSLKLNKQQQGHLAVEALTRRSLGRASRPKPNPKPNHCNRSHSQRPARIILHPKRPRPRRPTRTSSCSLATVSLRRSQPQPHLRSAITRESGWWHLSVRGVMKIDAQRRHEFLCGKPLREKTTDADRQ